MLDRLEITGAADRTIIIDDLGTKASAHLNRAHFAMVAAQEGGAASPPAAPSDRWYRLYDQMIARGVSRSSYVTAAALLFNELADLEHRSEKLPRSTSRSVVRDLVLREVNAGRQFMVELLESVQANVNETSIGGTPLREDVKNKPNRGGDRDSGVAAYVGTDTQHVSQLLSLEELVVATVAGKVGAYDQLMAKLHPLVLHYCRARLGPEETVIGSAGDVAQEVCLSVLSALPHYRDQGRPFMAFVYGIAAHKVAEAHRSSARNRADPVAEIPDEPAQADGPEQRALQAELAGRMGRLLGILPDKQREILVLRIVVGLTVAETALAVGSTPGRVRITQHRALSRLRRHVLQRPSSLTTSAVSDDESGGNATALALNKDKPGGTRPGDELDVLVDAAVRGERPAMDALLRWIDPLVVRYCHARLGRQERTFASADDVAQEVLLAVMTALPHYRDQVRPFLAFVYGIAAHKVADARRAAARNKSDPVAEVPDELAEADSPEQRALQAELAGGMDGLLAMLPEKQLEILMHRVGVALSVEDTVDLVGSSSGAVLNHLRKVLAS